MLRQRMVVGIGEALLLERAQGREAAGLAVRAAREAIRLGQVGVAVSRLGQDARAEALLALLREAGIRVDHMQSDPDLPTGRAVVRSAAGRGAGHGESQQVLRPAAHDNLQWDFDLVDLAQQADVVVYGTAACTSGQTRAVIQQFLDAASAATRLVDLTNRPPVPLDRALSAPLVTAADIALADGEALLALAPGPRDGNLDDAASRLLRQHDLGLVLLVRPEEARGMAAFDRGRRWDLERPVPAALATLAALGVALAINAGSDVPTSLRLASRLAEFVQDRPGEPLPQDLLAPTD